MSNKAPNKRVLKFENIFSSGNIRVFCRCRPLNTEEIDGGASVAIDFEAAKDGELTVSSNGISRKIFKFDAVFSPENDQCNWIVTHAFRFDNIGGIF